MAQGQHLWMAAHSHFGHLIQDYSQLLECPEGHEKGKKLLGKPNLAFLVLIFFPTGAGIDLLDQGKITG